ncbi:unnamed protein product, partial [Meganyctiphanes norvegica]
ITPNLSSSSTSPISPSAPMSPPSKPPQSLFSITEGYNGPPIEMKTPPMVHRSRKLSLPKDVLQQDLNHSPSLAELARRLHANPNHLSSDQDYVDFMDLDQPYVSPVKNIQTAASLIQANHYPPNNYNYGRKNSTGSLGLSSCASLLEDKSYYSSGVPPLTAASIANLNSEDYSNVFNPQPSAFRKVHSTSNVTGGSTNRLNQRHQSINGDDNSTESKLRKSLSKSRELLSQLEHEYQRIKGDESKSTRNSLVIDPSWLEKDFDQLLQTLSGDKTLTGDPHEALAFLSNNNIHMASNNPLSVNKAERWRPSKKDFMPPLPASPVDSPRGSRKGQQGPPIYNEIRDSRNIFSFFQKKDRRSNSLTGMEGAIKISLPSTPEDGVPLPMGVDYSRRMSNVESAYQGPPQGRSTRSNSIPTVMHTGGDSKLPHELVSILRKTKSLSKPQTDEDETDEVNILENSPEYLEEIHHQQTIAQEGDEVEGEQPKQQRSLSLPKSFLSDKYGLTGFKAALPSVIFPWRRGDSTRNSGRGSPCPTASYDAQALPHGDHHDDYDANTDPRGKDGVARRQRGGGGGMSRNSRKEKASSSPVFRRASLSHSEWDIRRPWSQVYSERDAAKLSQSVCRLAMAEGGHMGEECLDEEGEGPRSLPYMPSSAHNSSEGMFQKFKKSLSLRLAKKGSRSDSMGPVSPTPLGPQSPEAALLEAQTLPRRRGSVSKEPREEDGRPPQSFLFGHPLFRSSKERRRARLKDARSSKCNSGDSGDSGIELVPGVGYGPVLDSGHMTSLEMPHEHHHHHHHDLVDSSNYVDPAFVASLAEEGVSCVGVEYNPRLVRRTHSDAGGEAPRPQAGYPVYQRQLSTPQPIKLRPAHRLPHHSTASLNRRNNMKRSKGSSHLLRRSISQPLDLNKSYDTPVSSFRKCRSPTHDNPSRRQRRPSAGNILNEDNTTSDDEYGMSDNEDFKVDLKRSLEEEDDLIVYAEALWDHVTLDAEELVFRAGDLITVIDSSDKDWWWGRIGGKAGWFPAAFVRLLVNQEEHQDSLGVEDSPYSGPSRKLSISGLSHDQIRTNVINEIISTERDFVKHLKDVVEGYLKQVQQRPDMFTQEHINTIFGNMEALYNFQSSFLSELEKCINWEQPHKSCIGECFIRQRGEFEIYSEYCNNHPSASSALQELYQDAKYVQFFEACRLLQEMIDISLDGFLLTPVQKICKYPLQLQELLKYTRPEHPDYIGVQGALEAMRDVALLVNERKRRMECLEKIASWQIAVEGWEGQELLEDSSQLIYQGEVTKGVGGSWPKEVSLFLFDHQLIYCKRDMLKRNIFVYRGRLNLDKCDIVDLPDGKDPTLNISVHNAWKIHSLEKNKRYIFSCKSAAEKYKWMEAFKRERELVAADEDAGFVVADKAKQLAKIAAKNMKNRPKRPRTPKNHKRVQAMTYAQAELLVNLDSELRSNSLPSSGVAPPEGGKKKGLWFSFGGQKKGRSRMGQAQHHPV